MTKKLSGEKTSGAKASASRPSGGKPSASKPSASKPSASKPSGVKASGGDRPRIKASHAEGAADKKAPRGPAKSSAATKSETSPRDLEKRRTRARATVKALGRAPAAKRATPSTRAAAPGFERPRAPTPRKRTTTPAEITGPSAAACELAIQIAAAGLDKKAIGIEVIDVTGRVDYADFLVIMTGTSDRHVHALAMGIEGALKQRKIAALSVEGLTNCNWVLMDFEDVVVHLFQEETRKLYDIEGLWMDATRLTVPTSLEQQKPS